MASSSSTPVFLLLLATAAFDVNARPDIELLRSNRTIVAIDPTFCHWKGAEQGETVSCSDQEVVVASCSSGTHPGCTQHTENRWYRAPPPPLTAKKYSDEVLCCHTKVDFRRSEQCTELHETHGAAVECPVSSITGEGKYLLRGVCGSGRNSDCQAGLYGASHSIQCCRHAHEGRPVRASALCYWRWGVLGEAVRCTSDREAVVGRCASGANPDCDPGFGFHHGIKCCELVYDQEEED